MPAQTPASNSDARKRNAERERPAPAAREAAAEDVIERAARVLAQLEPGEEWPSNAALGGNPTGTRDGLGWLHDFALSDALARNPYRATRIAGATDTEGSK